MNYKFRLKSVYFVTNSTNVVIKKELIHLFEWFSNVILLYFQVIPEQTHLTSEGATAEEAAVWNFQLMISFLHATLKYKLFHIA